MIDIVACANDKYTMPCGIMLTSACINNKKGNLHFHIFVDKGFQEKSKNKLRNISSTYQNPIDFYLITDEMSDQFLQFETLLYPRHVFYRLLMPIILSESIEKVLYLDCDIIIRHDLTSLVKTNLCKHSVGCVYDALVPIVTGTNRLGYPSPMGYFNSGVLLVNLKFWRENNLLSCFNDFIKSNANSIILPDQDVLNYVLRDSKFFLPITYNFQSAFLYKDKYRGLKKEEVLDEVKTTAADPTVLHFAGERPWLKGCKHPYKQEFIKYKNLTEWKDEPLGPSMKSFKQRIKETLRKPLSKFGFCDSLDLYDKTFQLS